MMKLLSLNEIGLQDRKTVGGKGLMLARMAKHGFQVPKTVCVPEAVYRRFVQESGLQERILLEIHRKDFREMRWEEVWDTALRIRNMFARKEMSDGIKRALSAPLSGAFGENPVVVRSSAPEEDSSRASFAGLHESFVNVHGVDSILDHIKLVWASLWSDAALLYRRELDLDVRKSTMAVVVQELVFGERSGVAFSKSPQNDSQAVIEAVYGLNQGLVDGMIEPDRWIIDRQKPGRAEHQPATRERFVIPASDGIRTEPLSSERKGKPPLDKTECRKILDTVMQMEKLFESPQDMEWTIREGSLYILQARAITTTREDSATGSRGWYLSLRRSFDNLSDLKNKIEMTLIPQMIEIAEDLSKIDLSTLSDNQLTAEIDKRLELNRYWTDVYWKEFIPFAHGMRLFGQFYNDRIHPEDPYEFMDLLQNDAMLSMDRNQKLAEMAGEIQNDPQLRKHLENRENDSYPAAFKNRMADFIESYGDLSCAVTGGRQCEAEGENLIRLLLKMAGALRKRTPARKPSAEGQQAFLSRFREEEQEQAKAYLELARASYRLRDDDNIHLGRIESQMLLAVQEAAQRLFTGKSGSEKLKQQVADISYQKENKDRSPAPEKTETKTDASYRVKPRQLTGQPAGPGVARGKARVILSHSDLADFSDGEILVCDSVDPNMTFIVPLAAGIVERRGGMLIHGAIIAREYGLPCVTGVPDVTSLISNGKEITVDGYLGIVTVH